MEVGRQRHLIWWRFWMYFAKTLLNTKLFSHLIIRFDHGWSGVTATTPLWFVAQWGCPRSCSLGTSIHPVVAVTPSQLWSIPLVTYIINGSDNGLLPTWHQAIIWSNAGLSLSSQGKTAVQFEMTGSWNPSSSKTRTYPFHIINIMVADVLATQGARASAATILT